jgi:hypothetical protein
MSSKPTTPISIAAAALALGAAFFAGRATVSRDEVREEGGRALVGVNGKLPRGAEGGQEGGTVKRARERDAQRSGGDGLKGQTVAARLMDILSEPDPISRSKAWLDFVNSLSAEEYQGALNSFMEGDLEESRPGELSILMSAWARVDPLSALAYADDRLSDDDSAARTVLSTWAAYDVEGALRWANEHHDGDGANPYMIGIIEGLVSHDPAKATELLKAMPFSDECGEVLAVMVPFLLRQGADQAKAWVDSIDDEQLKNGALSRFSEALAARDPQAAADWLLSSNTDATRRSLDNVLSEWAQKDLTGATSYFDKLPQGEARTNALRGITNELATKDPQAAAQFLDTHAADANDQTYQQFVWHSFGEDPGLAVSYVEKLSNPGEKERMYTRLLGGWLRRDAQAASAWFNASGQSLPQAVKDRFSKQIQEAQNR